MIQQTKASGKRALGGDSSERQAIMSEQYQHLVAQIAQVVGDIAQSKGLPRPTVRESMPLLGGGLPVDSLDLASILLQLESLTGHDPFKAGFIDFRTVGELARLYTQ